MRSARPETHELSVGCYSLVQDSLVGCLDVQDPGSIPSTANNKQTKSGARDSLVKNCKLAAVETVRWPAQHHSEQDLDIPFCRLSLWLTVLAMQISDPQVHQLKPTTEMSSKLQMGLHSTPDREGSCWGWGWGGGHRRPACAAHSQAPNCHQRPPHSPGEVMDRKGV